MLIDDPTTPEFSSIGSYRVFAKRVRNERRYIWRKETQAFLDTVLVTSRDRKIKIENGTILYRAQRGIDYRPITQDGVEVAEEPVGFGADRMKPLVNRAKEGRVNPSGIPSLYLASSEKTAISEVRPWIGSQISVAQFRVNRNLQTIDLSLGHGQVPRLGLYLGTVPITAEDKEKAVWIDIDNAFSCPITLSDDSADYVPTQILAELFRDAGYDGVIYRSQFGEKGYNIALFNIEDAEAVNCAPFEVTGIDITYKQTYNAWFASKK